MSARIIDGKAHAARLRAGMAAAMPALVHSLGRPPGLAVVLVGDNPASDVYVRSKTRQTNELGMRSFEHRYPADLSQTELLALLKQLNDDPVVDGILVQLPLPAHIDEAAVIHAIDPRKDVDGFHIVNAGRLAIGQSGLVPCTPAGCLMLLKETLGSLEGKEAVVIGRSNIVGKPMALLLLGEHCTVTLAHSRTRHLPDVVRRADIVVAAVGRAHYVMGDWLKEGAVVIDVGINRLVEAGVSRLVGDVDFTSCAAVAGAITPVPGGVGPMTIAYLLRNTIQAACTRAGLAVPDFVL